MDIAYENMFLEAVASHEPSLWQNSFPYKSTYLFTWPEYNVIVEVTFSNVLQGFFYFYRWPIKSCFACHFWRQEVAMKRHRWLARKWKCHVLSISIYNLCQGTKCKQRAVSWYGRKAWRVMRDLQWGHWPSLQMESGLTGITSYFSEGFPRRFSH
jgi:hypothetical protein